MRRTELVAAGSRLFAGIALLSLVGALPWLSQRDPAASILRARYAELEPTPEALDSIRRELGLDGGPVAISLRWWQGVLRGDLGTSWVSGRPIGTGVFDALGVSATLTVFALAVALTVAALIVLPVARRVMTDRPVRGSGPVGIILTALPEFLLASVLLVVVAIQLQWLPPYGWTGMQYAILPALALGVPAGGLLGRLLGDAIAGVTGERWLEVWRLAGTSRLVLLGATLRRAAAAVIDQLGLVVVGLLGGAVAVEQVFAIPGLGRYLLGSANAQDLPALQAGVLIVALVAVVIGILTRLARTALMGGSLPPGAVPAPPEARGDDRTSRWTFGIAVTLLVLVLAFGLPRDPYTIGWGRLQAPSAALPFGADASGRDVLARVAHGAIGTLVPAFVVVLIAVVIGLLLAFRPTLWRGPIELANATPPIIAGIVVAALAGPSVAGAAVAVLWVTWPPLAAHAAALVDEARAMPHIRWMPLSGAGPAKIAVSQIVPVVVAPLLRHAMLRLPGAALALASLGFLGLGAKPPFPEWGLLLAEGIGYVERAPWATIAPAGALALVSVISVTSIAVRMPRRRRRAMPVTPVAAEVVTVPADAVGAPRP